jgi:hypothetical protein
VNAESVVETVADLNPVVDAEVMPLATIAEPVGYPSASDAKIPYLNSPVAAAVVTFIPI